MTPDELQKLVAQLTARANKEHGVPEVPGSPSARRFETMRQISAQMEREGHFEFRRRSDGSVSIHMTNERRAPAVNGIDGGGRFAPG